MKEIIISLLNVLFIEGSKRGFNFSGLIIFVLLLLVALFLCIHISKKYHLYENKQEQEETYILKKD